MNKLIPNFFISDLLARINIVDLINAKIKLKKQGKKFYAHCPFHNEKTPSFIVNEERQIYHCFGCNAHGNIIDFLMNYERTTFIESIQELATIHNLKIPYNTNNYPLKEQKIYKKMYYIMEKINNFYQKILQNKISINARNYLEQRQINEKIIRDFSIGFSLPGWNNIAKNFVKTIEDHTLLINVGMIVVNEHGHSYDRFRERIMFPIRNKYGQIIAFGGRIICKKQKPKYINSPETKIFHKSTQLYGLYEIQKKHSQLSQILVVEGYMDVLALAQFEINYSVASLGISLTKEHIQILYRNTDRVICCYDGDNAGREAAWRTLEQALPYLNDRHQLYFIFLPENEDPDSLIRKIGKTKFELYIKEAQPMSKFLFEAILLKVNINTPEGCAKFSKIALPLIHKIPDEILRLYLIQQLGNIIGIIDERRLEKILLKTKINTSILPKIQIKYTTMRILISLLIQNPQLSNLVPSTNELEQINLPGIKLFIDLLQTCYKIPSKLTTGQLLEFYREKYFFSQLEKLAVWNHMIIDKAIKTTFSDILNNLYRLKFKNRQEKLIILARTNNLTIKERQELWFLNKKLAKIKQ